MKCSRKSSFEKRIKIGNLEIESVCSFKYLGTMVNTNNVTEEKIKAKTVAGHRAY
jgi:hypothetical protein